jgi:D-3-phosphoglycerate dehydrogenase
LIADEMHPSLPGMLAAIGCQADYRPRITPEQLRATIARYEGLVVRSKISFDAALLALAPGLRFIARAGAGTDQIDTAETQRRGIAILNAPEGNRDAVGERTLGLLLALLHHLPQADRQVRQGQWRREANRGTELGALTVGIIGYGHMGRAFAQRLRGFGCPVLAYDKYHSGFGNAEVQEVTLAQLQQQADVLSLHVPLTPETRGWVGEAFFAQLARPVYLLNTARGEIVPLTDLVAALQRGQVRAAALDVLENEKLDRLTPAQAAAFAYLAQAENVIFSPHVAGWTHQSYIRINEVLVDKIAAFYKNG